MLPPEFYQLMPTNREAIELMLDIEVDAITESIALYRTLRPSYALTVTQMERVLTVTESVRKRDNPRELRVLAYFLMKGNFSRPQEGTDTQTLNLGHEE